MKRLLFVVMCMCLVSMAHALSITNGDFETGAPTWEGSNADVAGWYDYSSGGFWGNAWHMNAWPMPNDSAGLLLSAFAANTSVDGAGQNGYCYQSIGTAGGVTSLTLAFEWGSPDDASGPKDLGLTFTILESDGTFVPTDQVDILGQSGITVIDQISELQTDVPIGQVFNAVWTFDLSSAGAGELFLRINNYEADPDLDESWIPVDNIRIIPEPITMLLLGLGGLLVRKR